MASFIPTQVVEYTYDSWGKPLTKTGSLATTLGTLNPFRYRGYVYDEETQLYYLRSRYYNPAWGRFVNGDIVIGEKGKLLSHNIFTYCNNSPIELSDESGYVAAAAATIVYTSVKGLLIAIGAIFGWEIGKALSSTPNNQAVASSSSGRRAIPLC